MSASINIASRFAVAAILVPALTACGSARATPATPFANSPSATAGAPSATFLISPSPATWIVGDGEPWIVYQWTPDRGPGLYLMRADGSDAHEIAIGLAGEAGHPDWSPDGKQIVFELMVSENVFEIWTVNADGSNPAKVYGCETPPCVQVGVPAWSPDGRHLAFARLSNPSGDYHDDHLTIEVLDLDAGEARVIASAPRTTSQAVEYVNPRWSPDGAQVVFIVNSYALPPTNESLLGSSIAVVNADGSEKDAPRILTEPALFASNPDWSPDGARIVFNTHGLGFAADLAKAADLYIMSADGTGLTKLTAFDDGAGGANQPSWTPDGASILYTSIWITASNPEGERHPAYIDPDGSDGYVMRGVFATHARLRPMP